MVSGTTASKINITPKGVHLLAHFEATLDFSRNEFINSWLYYYGQTMRHVLFLTLLNPNSIFDRFCYKAFERILLSTDS